MLKVNRQEELVVMCDEFGSLNVKEAAEELGVSEMTVRRDLDELAQAGRLVRVHGGARKPADPASPMVGRELAHTEKRALHVEDKERAAALAADMVCPGETVFIGTGTTMEALASQLPSGPLRVVTNSLSAFLQLRDRDDVDLCLIGGDYRASTDAFVGPLAEQCVAALGLDLAFVGCNGVGPDGISTSNAEEGRLQNVVLERSERRVAVCDGSKLGRRDFYTFFPVEGLDAVVCPGPADPDRLAALGERTQVIR